jgi:hypothetical protein
MKSCSGVEREARRAGDGSRDIGRGSSRAGGFDRQRDGLDRGEIEFLRGVVDIAASRHSGLIYGRLRNACPAKWRVVFIEAQAVG